MSAAGRWRDDLERWAIPEWILSQAPESPWIHPPALFGVPEHIADSPSHARAREALGDEGSVLDVGCGGGVAAMAVAPPANRVVGVDEQPEMLALFTGNARARGLEVATVEGRWPGVAERTPVCEVVTCHHVVYNVPDIVPFVLALDAHASRRVVIEMPTRHPLSSLDGAWRHFWGIERPRVPTPDDLLEVLDESGLTPRVETFEAPSGRTIDDELAARFIRIRLCLAPEREPEVRRYLDEHPAPVTHALATLWWDRASLA